MRVGLGGGGEGGEDVERAGSVVVGVGVESVVVELVVVADGLVVSISSLVTV